MYRPNMVMKSSDVPSIIHVSTKYGNEKFRCTLHQ